MVGWLEPRGGGDLQVVVLLKKECSFSGDDMKGGGNTQPLQDGIKNFELCTLRGTFQLSLAP